MERHYETISTSQQGYVARITLNRPDKLNAINRRMILELTSAVDEISMAAAAGSVRAVIIEGGGGRAFAAGADINEMASMNAAEACVLSASAHRLAEWMESAPMPFIAAVNGFALGGGCELVLACDLAYAADNARIGQPEVNLGVIPGFGGTQRLMRRVGSAKAREMVFTAAVLDATEALRIGLINGVFPADELADGVTQVAETIASKGPLAVGAAKRVLVRGADIPLATANELESRTFATLFGSEDQKEGMSAFLNKRQAVFRGR